MYQLLRALFGVADRFLIGLGPMNSSWIKRQLIKGE